MHRKVLWALAALGFMATPRIVADEQEFASLCGGTTQARSVVLFTLTSEVPRLFSIEATGVAKADERERGYLTTEIRTDLNGDGDLIDPEDLLASASDSRDDAKITVKVVTLIATQPGTVRKLQVKNITRRADSKSVTVIVTCRLEEEAVE